MSSALQRNSKVYLRNAGQSVTVKISELSSLEAENIFPTQFKSLSSKNLYSNVKPSFFLWPHFS